jgi:hypothetical protein
VIVVEGWSSKEAWIGDDYRSRRGEERLQRLGKVEGWWAWMTVKVQARRSVEIS